MLAKGYVFVGDHSASNSETWNLSIGLNGTGESYVHEADQAGVVIRDKRNFKTGETYAAQLTHTGSTYDSGNEDFDYRAWVDRDPSPAWTSGDTPRSDAEFFITDSADVLQKRFFGDNENPISTSTPDALIHFPAIDLDIDSLNDSGFAVPNDNPAEDYTEYDNHFGKTVDINPDSDVFDALATSFVPVRLALSSNVIGVISSLSLVFNYDMADTSGSSDGLMRLWTKDADQARTPETAPYYGSDLIPSNVPIDPHNFHLSNGQSLYSALTGGEGATLYLEGVNETNRYSLYDSIEVSAIVSVSTGETNWSGTLSDTVHVRTLEQEIKSVEFVPTDELDLSSVADAQNYGFLETGTNPNGTDDPANKFRNRLIEPAFGGGDRFFPDSDIQDTSQGRNIVRVRAVVEGLDEGDNVLFLAVDVDDPTNDRKLDANDTTTKENGSDNRGRLDDFHNPGDSAKVTRTSGGFHGRLRSVNDADGQQTFGDWGGEHDVVEAQVKMLDGQLVAEVDLLTSFAPGDNFRVVAVTEAQRASIENTTVKNEDDKFQIATDIESPLLSPQLAVWRHLHVEDDTAVGQPLYSLMQPTVNRQENRFADAYIVPNYDVVAAVDTSDPPAGGQLRLRANNSIAQDQIDAIEVHRQTRDIESRTFWAVYITDSYTSPTPPPASPASPELREYIAGVTSHLDETAYEFSVVFDQDNVTFYEDVGGLVSNPKIVVHEVGHQVLQYSFHRGNTTDIGAYGGAVTGNSHEPFDIDYWQDKGLNIMNESAVEVPMNNTKLGDVDYFFFWRSDIDRLRRQNEI